MPVPFPPAVKGTTAGTPSTGAFTPNAASAGFRAWSTVPTGWIGLVRYEDGAAWELTYSYWNGTTLSRASTQVYDSSTGSQLTLTSAATAALIVDGAEIMPHVGGAPVRGLLALPNVSNGNLYSTSVSVFGTAAAAALATTNFLTEQARDQYTSATTANAQAGWSVANAQNVYSTAAGRGGGEYVSRFGASALPTGPRLFAGLGTVTFGGSTGEPSALSASIAAFAKDSGDTNIQLLTKDGTTANKVDTGIPLAANGWYEASIWFDPGGGTVWGLLIRLDTGAIWLGKTSTNLPANGSLMLPQAIGGLSSTTGTAVVFHIGSLTTRTGGG